MMTAQQNAEALDAKIEEGRKAHRDGQPMHANPYDYRFEAVAANAWDDGWKEAAR